MTKSLYEILEVLPNASQEVIREAYRSLSAKYHPDKDGSKEAAEIFNQIQLAFETLSDTIQRARYDDDQQSLLMEIQKSVNGEHVPEVAFPAVVVAEPFENTSSNTPPKESSWGGMLLIALACIFLAVLAFAIHLANSHSDKMTSYRDTNSDSGISAYKYGNDWIQVQFKDGRTYEYRASKIGQSHINEMKRLADSGDGLNTYISTNQKVKHGWSSKIGENDKDSHSANGDASLSPSIGASNTNPRPVETKPVPTTVSYSTLSGQWKTSTGDLLNLSDVYNPRTNSYDSVYVELVKSSSWISGSGTLTRQGNSLTGDLSGNSRNRGRRTWKFEGKVMTDNQIDFTVDFYVNDYYESGTGIRGRTLESRPVRGYMTRNADTPNWYKP